MNNKSPIIIIGAARSGTHLLAKCITQNINVRYLAECNELWKKHLPANKYDIVPDKHINDKSVSKIRNDFIKIVNNSNCKYWMEKTPSNILRLNLVTSAFPEAKYIHIIRNGVDVAISAEKKMQGNINKISKIENRKRINNGDRWNSLLKNIKHKIGRGLSLKTLLRDKKRYLSAFFRIMGLNTKTFFGPRFAGYEFYFKNYSLLELAAIQWRESVLSALDFFSVNSQKKMLEIRYEDLIEHPEKVLKKVLEFITDDEILEDNIKHDVNRKIKSSYNNVELFNNKKVLVQLYTTLKKLKYINT